MNNKKKFTVNERLNNLEKGLGELYMQFTALLRVIKEEDGLQKESDKKDV